MSTELIVRIDSKIDRKVYTDFSNFNSFTLGKKWLTMILADAALLVFAVVNWFTEGKVLAYLCIGLALSFPVLYIIWYRVSLQGQIQRYHLEEPRHFYTVKLSSAGIDIQNETQHTSFTWKQIYRVYELEAYFYVYITKARGYILPKKDITSGTEDIIRSIVKAYLPGIRYIDKR